MLGDGAAMPEACPVCGARVDAAHLRSLADVGEEPGSPWHIFRHTVVAPKQFFRSLPSPRHYVLVPPGVRFYEHTLFLSFVPLLAAAIVSAIRLDTILVICFTAPAALSWLFCLSWAHHAVPRRMARQLSRTAHQTPNRGAERVMLLSAGGYVLLAAAFCVLLVSMGSLTHYRGQVFLSTEVIIALSIYLLAWAAWVRIVRRAWQAETRGLAVGAATVLLNPALLILLVPVFVAYSVVATYLTMLGSLMK
jgi:hypothetical protein